MRLHPHAFHPAHRHECAAGQGADRLRKHEVGGVREQATDARQVLGFAPVVGLSVELALGLLHRRELRRAGNAETGVIEQYIDAPLGVEHRLNRRGDGRFVRHVRRHMVNGRAAAAFFMPGKLVHRAAVRGKVFRCRRADAGAAAGHDGDLSHGCGLLLCE